MRRILPPLIIALLALAVLTAQPGMPTRAVSAQSGGGYDLTWNTIDGGGGASTGGGYTLSSTAGQPDAGTQGGGATVLSGGFWNSSIDALKQLFLPLIRR